MLNTISTCHKQYTIMNVCSVILEQPQLQTVLFVTTALAFNLCCTSFKPTLNYYAEQTKRADAKTNFTNSYKLKSTQTQLTCRFAGITCATFTNVVTQPAFFICILTSLSAESGVKSCRYHARRSTPHK